MGSHPMALRRNLCLGHVHSACNNLKLKKKYSALTAYDQRQASCVTQNLRAVPAGVNNFTSQLTIRSATSDWLYQVWAKGWDTVLPTLLATVLLLGI